MTEATITLGLTPELEQAFADLVAKIDALAARLDEVHPQPAQEPAPATELAVPSPGLPSPPPLWPRFSGTGGTGFQNVCGPTCELWLDGWGQAS